MHCRSAGNHDVDLSAKRCTPFCINQFVIPFPFPFIKPAIGPFQLIPEGKMECAPEYPAFRSFQLLTCGYQFIIYFFEQPWYGRHDLGMNLLHIIRNGTHVFSIVDGNTEILVKIVQHPFIDMAERKVADRFMFLSKRRNIGSG